VAPPGRRLGPRRAPRQSFVQGVFHKQVEAIFVPAKNLDGDRWREAAITHPVGQEMQSRPGKSRTPGVGEPLPRSPRRWREVESDVKAWVGSGVRPSFPASQRVSWPPSSKNSGLQKIAPRNKQKRSRGGGPLDDSGPSIYRVDFSIFESPMLSKHGPSRGCTFEFFVAPPARAQTGDPQVLIGNGKLNTRERPCRTR